MSPNVDNFFIFELRIITFFLNVVLIMDPNVNNFFLITQYYLFINVLKLTPNMNNFFLIELPIITFLKFSLDNDSKCE